MSVPEELQQNNEKIDKFIDEMSDIPEWAISDILHNKIINSGYKSTSRRIYLKKFTDKIKIEDVEGKDDQSNLLKFTMKMRQDGYPYWAISDILDVPLHKIIYISIPEGFAVKYIK